jgi:quercetin dioxygenase-like cupin family protein
MLKRITTAAALVALVVAGMLMAQQPAGTPPMAPIKRTLLQRVDVAGANYETVTGIAELMPSVNVGHHTHPGPETSYVLDGELTLLIDGKPAQVLKAGDSYQIAPVGIHDAQAGK